MKLKLYTIVFSLLFSTISLFAQVTFSGVSSLLGLCLNKTYTLPDITIGETNVGDFDFSYSYDYRYFYIYPPANFTFSNGIGNVSVNSNSDITEKPNLVVFPNFSYVYFKTDSYIPNENPSNINAYDADISTLTRSSSNYERASAIYTANEIKRAGTITGLSFFIGQNPNPNYSYFPLKIRLKTISGTNFPSYYTYYPNDTLGTRVVYNSYGYNGSYYSPNQELQIYFNSPFVYDGNSNIQIFVETQVGIYTTYPALEASRTFKALSSGSLSQYLSYTSLSNDINYIYNFSSTFYNIKTSQYEYMKPNIVFRFNQGQELKKDVFTITGMEVSSSSVSIGDIYLGYRSFTMNGTPPTVPLARLDSKNAIGLISGLSSNYCINSAVDTVSFFPPGGKFTLSPLSVSGILSTITSNKFIISPISFTGVPGEKINLTYDYPDVGACTVTSSSFSIQAAPTDVKIINFSSTYPLSNLVVPLVVDNSTGISGNFSGLGVLNNNFYVAQSDTGKKIVKFAYNLTSTGCGNTVYDTTYIYNEDATLVFYPPTTIGGNGKFCVDDPIQYRLSLFTVAGLLLSPEQVVDGYCNKSFAISSQPYINNLPPPFISSFDGQNFVNGISFVSTVTSVQNTIFSPSVAGVGKFTLFYTNDKLIIPNSSCVGERLSDRGQMFNWQDKKQNIEVYPLPAPPFVNSTLTSFCQGQVANTSINASSTASGALFRWYKNGVQLPLAVTVSSVNMSVLGITNASPVGIDSFLVAQNVNGCWGPATKFKIVIKPIPALPSLFFAKGKPKYCKNDPNISVKITSTQASISGYNLQWFSDVNAINSIVVNNDTLAPSIPNYTISGNTYYARHELNGCYSNLVTASVQVFELPDWDVFSPVSYQYCKAVAINDITVTGNVPLISTSPGGAFRWYSDASALTLIPGNFSGTTTGSGGAFAQIYHPNASKDTVKVYDYYARLKSDTAIGACLSSKIRKFSIEVIDIPTKPTIKDVDESSNNIFRGFEQCNGDITISGFQITNPKSGVVYSWYKAPNTSVLGTLNITTTSLNFDFTSEIVNTTANAVFNLTQTLKICESLPQQARLIIKPKVPNAVVTLLSYFCTDRPIPELTATTIAGGSIFWYQNSNDVNAISNSISYQPSQSIGATPGIRSFYVKQKFDNCFSDVTTVNLAFRQTPATPLALDAAYCSDDLSIKTISGKANYLANSSFRWFYTSSDTTGNFAGLAQVQQVGSENLFYFTTTIAGGISDNDFSVVQMNNGCVSNVADLKIKVFAKPIAPVVNVSGPDATSTICSGFILPDVNAQGVFISWYPSSVNGTNAIFAGQSNFSPSNSSFYVNTVQWVSATVPPLIQHIYASNTDFKGTRVGDLIFNAGCESSFTDFPIAIYPMPPVPVASSPFPYCSGDQLKLLSATGVASNANISWYKRATLDQASILSDSSLTCDPKLIITDTLVDFKLTEDFFIKQTFNGCSQDYTTIQVTINPLPIVNIISPINDKYCNYDNPISIYVSPIQSGFSTFTGSSFGGYYTVTGIGSGFNTISGVGLEVMPRAFSTSLIKENADVKYIYKDFNGCINSASTIVVINPRPVISFTGVASQYCINDQTVSLGASPAGGTITVLGFEGISGNEFTPFKAGLGTKTLRYTYQDPNTQCNDTLLKSTIIYPNPLVGFTVSSHCLGNTAVFNDTSVVLPPSQVVKWNWNFNNLGDTAIVKSPSYTFKGIGDFKVVLEVQTDLGGCKSKLEAPPFKVGPSPTADFTWQGICFGSPTKLISQASIDVGNISKYSWEASFNGVKTKLATEDSAIVQYSFNAKGANMLTLTVTSDQNCTSSITKTVNILPTISLAGDALFENFSSGDGGWFAEGRNSDWIYGTPNKTKLKSPGNNAWYTGASGANYQRNQSSWVNSPCYNFASAEKPMLVLKYDAYLYKDDGVVIQVTTNSGVAWQNLGDIGTGINWYNQSNIFGNPGEQKNFKNGWSIFNNANPNWIEARHALDNYIGAKNVRLRVALGSTANDIPQSNTDSYDGFGFDDVWIGERTKKVLIEQFTNTSNESVFTSNVNDIINSRQKDVAAIQYHASFPSADKFNLANPADPGSRVLYYGVQSTPRTVFDGNVFNVLSNNINTRTIDLRTLGTPKFLLSLTETVNGNSVKIDGELIADTVFSDSSVVLQIALVERFVTEDGIRYESVLRKMLPDAAGTLITQNWSKGRNYSFSQTWNATGVNDLNQLQAVAFVQNQRSREVYQVAYTGGKFEYNTATQSIAKEQPFVIYPNPALDKLLIKLKPDLDYTEGSIWITDLYGNTLLQKQITTTEGKHLTLDVSGFASGLYNVSLRVQGNSYNKKLTVIH